MAKHDVKKTTITFSLDKNLIDEIESEASSQGISVNARLNNILTQFFNFQKIVQEYGEQIVPKKSFQFYIDMIDEEDHVKHLEESIYEIIRVLIYQQNLPLTIKNIIDVFLKNGAITSGAFNSVQNLTDHNGNLIILVKHSYNLKWSRCCSKTLKNLFFNLFNFNVEYEVFSNSFILKFLERNII